MNDDVLAALAGANPIRAGESPAIDLDACLAEALRRSSSRTRARPGRSRRARPVTFAGIAAFVVVASALALGHPTVDFFTAKKAPGWQFKSFSRMVRLRAFLTGRPPGHGMTLAAPAREITEVKFGGHEHTLVVAPLENGGMCVSWSGAFGGTRCGPAPKDESVTFGLTADQSGPIAVNGVVYNKDATELRIRFEDGTSAEIPVVWVSKPIDAGFFLYPVGKAHRSAGHYPADLELFGSSGAAIATLKLPRGAPPLRQPVHAIPGFGTVIVPRQAVYSHRRLLFEVTTSVPRVRASGLRHSHVGFWIAPENGGGTCIWGAGLSGCQRHTPRPRRPLPIAPNFYSDTLCCQVGAGVTRVELRFQDGTRIELYPKVDGYLLAAIPPTHDQPGHRLTEEVAYNRAGRVLGTRTFDPTKPGQYPCAQPSVHVDGFTLCP